MSTLAGSRIRPHPIWKYFLLFALLIITGYLYAMKGALVYLGWLAIPSAIGLLALLYRHPKLNLYIVMFITFFMAVINRYIPVHIPWSFGVDLFLILALLMPAIKHWHNTDYSLASRSLAAMLGVWMLYIVLQLFNPEAVSRLAWLYVMRGMALYPLLIVLSALVILNSRKDFLNFFHLWVALSILGALWGIKQDMLGVSAAEQAWLNAGAKRTHVLFGHLRVFSYYFDAGTFGPAMGQISIAAFILCVGPFTRKRRIFYLVVGLLTLYGMMISGTRGALAVPAFGAITYLVMVRNYRLVAVGLLVLGLSFSFLKFTKIGQSNYTVNRLRSTLNPEDASLNIRLINREALSQYLQDKPFGGGVGSSGYWGRRFSKGTWLSHFEPDGLYTQIRAETGIVGRNLFVSLLVLILLRGIAISRKLQNEQDRYYAMGILAGYAGILVANYGNSVMTQFPNIFVTFLGLAFVYSMKYWDEEGKVNLPGKPTPVEGASVIKNSWRT